jgi:hypothetical protein
MLTAQPQEFEVAGYDCGDCHGPAGWRILKLTGFSHQLTAFPLEGSHQALPCVACHTGTTIREKHEFQIGSTECVTCHLDVHKTTLGNDCTQCHGMITWQVTTRTFDHETTQFSLLGAHREIPCQECHREQPMTQFSVVPTDCYGCHRKNYDEVEFPSHLSAGLDTDCEECHTIRRASWRPSTFSHDRNTNYVLTGKHREAQCAGCHAGVFAGTPQDCWSCHATDYELTGTAAYPNSPAHTQDPQYSESCELCHTTETWQEAAIDHALTAFPLTGAHENTDCSRCHGLGTYDLPVDCDGCHVPQGIAQTDYTISSYDHSTHNIANDCELCHSTQNWSDTYFNHLLFPPPPCSYCHLPEHEQAADPPHTNGNINTECQLCHQFNDWTIAPFPHTTEQTGYALTGLHLTVTCTDCHLNQRYNGTPNTCQNTACHLPDFQSTSNPDHQVYGYPPEYCEECHTEYGWSPHHYAHNLTIACDQCHLPDYQNAADPSHTDFPTTCDLCHTSTSDWQEAVFDHTLTSNPCESCHLTDYQNANDPPHTGFPTDCEVCHNSTSDWEDATFDHSITTETCETCHLTDYQNTTDPNHSADGYPTDCAFCHTSTTDWSVVNFDHSFPIYSGEHRDKWTTCTAECHIDPDDYSVFSCGLNGVCHEHDQSKMDSEHSDVTDYVYESSACYDCHPTGGGDEGGGDGDGDGDRHGWRDLLKKKPVWRKY